jgi:hypothetical protein
MIRIFNKFFVKHDPAACELLIWRLASEIIFPISHLVILLNLWFATT